VRPLLGELLLDSGAINHEQLDTALARQDAQKLPIGQLLVKLGFVTDDTMRLALSSQLGVPFVDPRKSRLIAVSRDPSIARSRVGISSCPSRDRDGR